MGWKVLGVPPRTYLPGRKGNDTVSQSQNDAGPQSTRQSGADAARRSGAKRKHPIPVPGQQYGELTVVAVTLGERGGIRRVEFLCSCGETTFPHMDNVNAGRTKRCRICAKKAGKTTQYTKYSAVLPNDEHRERLLNRLSAQITRCHRPSSRQYKDYGERGIQVYKPWREDRSEFLRYIQTLPGWDDPQLEIDRIDNDAGYEPGNLRFATRRQNCDNRRTVSGLQRQLAAANETIEKLRARIRYLE